MSNWYTFRRQGKCKKLNWSYFIITYTCTLFSLQGYCCFYAKKKHDLYSKQWKVALTTSTVISSISFTTFTIPYNSHIIANHSNGIPYLAIESQTIVYTILARAWTFGTYSTAKWRRSVNLHKQFNSYQNQKSPAKTLFYIGL